MTDSDKKIMTWYHAGSRGGKMAQSAQKEAEITGRTCASLTWEEYFSREDFDEFYARRRDNNLSLWKDHIHTARYFEQKESNQMNIYQVVVVNKELDEIVYSKVKIASNEHAAELVALAEIMRESAPSDEVVAKYHFAIEPIGDGYDK